MLYSNFLTVDREDKEFKFEFHQNATLGQLFDVLTEMRGFVIQKIDEINVQAEQKEEAVEVKAEEKEDGSENT